MNENRRLRRWIVVALAALVCIGGCRSGGEADVESGGGGSFTVEDDNGSSPSGTGTLIAGSPAGPLAAFSELPPILVTELPSEALDTLDLIAAGGPYPFDRDGLLFENREGLLPAEPLGHYQEFTVVTPGVPTRGARRIVAGADGELYYTEDHYASFFEIRPED